MFHFTYLQALVSGLIQGITELFPVSSLGHSVLIPNWLGGSWKTYAQSPQYLLIAIALHLASALALFIVFAPRWIKILKSVLTLKTREQGFQIFILLLLGTLPVAAIGLVLNSFFQKNFTKPLSAAIFLFVNGFILYGTERLTRKRHSHVEGLDEDSAILARVSKGQALTIGVGQSAALFAGISRFGVTVSFGMLRGLSRTVASDFAFLLSFPVILGASIFKLPKLMHGGLTGSSGPLLFASVISFLATVVSVKFLVKWFKVRTLTPFAVYCVLFGAISIFKFWN